MKIDQDTTPEGTLTDAPGLRGFEWHVQYNPSWMGWELYCQRVSGDRIQYVQDLVMRAEDHSPGTFREPAFRLEPSAAQGLMNALWKGGLRPTGKEHKNPDDLQAHMDDLRVAKDSHLADLQKIVFNADTVSMPRALYKRMCGMIESGKTEDDPELPETEAVGFVTEPTQEEETE